MEVFYLLQTITLRGKKLKVDLVGELSEYFEGHNVRWTEDKLSAPSPFRYDNNPSFVVNLTNTHDRDWAGTWLDSGTGETGTLEILLAHLRNETVYETIDYLQYTYGIRDYEKLRLNAEFKMKEEWKPLLFTGNEFAKPFRGLTDSVIHHAGLMELEDKYVFHWYNPKGVIVAIKYRYKDRKDFYYEKGGKRLNQQVYNIQRCYERRFDYLWICEGEVDALSVEAYGKTCVGVALGGASVSDNQRDMVLRAGISNIIIASDNDNAGNKLAKTLQTKLGKYARLFRADLHDCKDINEYVQKYGTLPLANEIKNKSWGFSKN